MDKISLYVEFNYDVIVNYFNNIELINDENLNFIINKDGIFINNFILIDNFIFNKFVIFNNINLNINKNEFLNFIKTVNEDSVLIILVKKNENKIRFLEKKINNDYTRNIFKVNIIFKNLNERIMLSK